EVWPLQVGQQCPQCQRTAPQRPLPVPLIPLPIIGIPFKRVGMDLVGPLPKSARGHEYILVNLDYATRYPAAVPLRKATSHNIARELVLLFSRVGIPKDMLTDQGTPFVSKLMSDLCRLLQVKHLNAESAPRHPRASPPFSSFLDGALRDCWTWPVKPGRSNSPTLGEDLTPAQKQELTELVDQISDVFSTSPGMTQLVHHEIKTPPSVVLRQRPYRVPEAWCKAINDEIGRMLRDRIIEESSSPWSSPIVIVPMPDGSMQLCNDFRKLNQVSEYDSYPLPRLDDHVEQLGRTSFISTLDLTKGYWQVMIAPDARPKTAFSTATGHWQYRVLPFGLHIPEFDAHPPAAPPHVCSCLPGQRCHPLLHMVVPPVSSGGGPEGNPGGWPDSQPQEMPPRGDRGTVPGISHWPGDAEATSKENRSRKGLPSTHVKETGTCLLGVGGVLPEVCA
ncbi:hypothetical protein AMELA_G00147600, partial [Ameiurus melas]